MLLAIDVGNTHTVLGGYDGQTLRFMWRLSTDKKCTEDEIRAKLSSMFSAGNIQISDVNGISLASVVPSLSFAWQKAVRELFACEAFVCNAKTAAGLFEADYPNTHEIGSDRVADAIAAKACYGAPVIVVDFGTATNIEVIDKHGKFVGGIIAPGIESSAQALFSQASKIASIELVAPESAIGKSTEQAVQSGIVLGEAGRVDGLVGRVFEQLGYEAPVIATGGQAYIISKYSKTISETNPHLTLTGLRLAFEYAHKNTQAKE